MCTTLFRGTVFSFFKIICETCARGALIVISLLLSTTQAEFQAFTEMRTDQVLLQKICNEAYCNETKRRLDLQYDWIEYGGVGSSCR